MNEIITTLHPENDENTNLYPNIKKVNIPSNSIDNSKLDSSIISLLNSINELHPSGVDTEVNILAFTENKGIWVANDTGYWYYWNGTQYTSGGVYQATQIADNSINGNNLNEGLGEYIYDNIDCVLGYIDSSTGTINLGGVNSIIKPLYLRQGNIVSLIDSPFEIFRVAKTDKYMTESTLASSSFELNVKSQTYTINSDGYYCFQIRVKNDTSGLSYSNLLDTIKEYFTINKSIKELYNYNDLLYSMVNNIKYVSGTIDNSGNVNTTQTSISNIIIGIFDNTTFTSLSIAVNSGYQFNYVYYNHSTKEFVSRGSWSTTDTIFNNDYDIIILGASISTLVDAESIVFNNINIKIDDNITYNEVVNKVKGIDFLSNIQACDFIGGNVHISIDDTYQCFKDLINDTPESIFDNSFFAWLQGLHNSYGYVFTLNLFNVVTDDSYDISNVPNTWSSEFQANKSWLKFAFHSGNSSDNYNTSTTFNADYTTFVTQIYRITGTYDCIDTIPRLGYFGGTLSQIKSYTGSYKPIGFLTADDNRISYYFTSTQNDLCNNNGKFYDVNNELIFFKSLLRLDSNGSDAIINEISNNIKYNKYIEIFFHEQTYVNGGANLLANTLSNLYNHFSQLNYNNKFLMDIFTL